MSELYEPRLADIERRERHWNRCGVCGRFIAYDDFDHGAKRVMITPDSQYSGEEWDTLCKKHAIAETA